MSRRVAKFLNFANSECNSRILAREGRTSNGDSGTGREESLAGVAPTSSKDEVPVLHSLFHSSCKYTSSAATAAAKSECLNVLCRH